MSERSEYAPLSTEDAAAELLEGGQEVRQSDGNKAPASSTADLEQAVAQLRQQVAALTPRPGSAV
eukprot:COSAG04_NODE_7503_length_1117_cov_0.908644_2_plen_64_part_01